MTIPVKKYDVKKGLEKYMPSLLRLIGNQNISWTSINSGLLNHLQKVRSELKESGESEIIKETTFYSFLVGNTQGKKETAPMFDFFETIFSELNERLSDKELVHLHKMVKFVLSNFDYRYLNFIGELATLNAYKSTGKYSLLNIEEKIYSKKGVRADLFMRRVSDKREFLVEIVNIHLENRNLNDSSKIKHHIESKLKLKIDKTFFESPKREIYIQPVVWIESLEQIQIISELYRKKKIAMDNVYVPMCYMTYQLSNGDYEHRFEYVTTILEEEQKKGNWISRMLHGISIKKR
ncbi:hypothetical protein [Marinifilum fragile]|uniref:hypothetical protein n=1 Tax=Marinifilum fragile TaxID=570161 RepID=UPI002AA7F651|nr:hypothetical protein [Marinifilum fragile]